VEVGSRLATLLSSLPLVLSQDGPGRSADADRGKTLVAWSPSIVVAWPGCRVVSSEIGWAFVAASRSAARSRWWRCVDRHRSGNSPSTSQIPGLPLQPIQIISLVSSRPTQAASTSTSTCWRTSSSSRVGVSKASAFRIVSRTICSAPRTRLSTYGDRAFPVAAVGSGTVFRSISHPLRHFLSSALNWRHTSSNSVNHNYCCRAHCCRVLYGHANRSYLLTYLLTYLSSTTSLLIYVVSIKPDPKNDGFMPLLRRQLMPICIKIRFIRFQIIVLTKMVTTATKGRKEGRTERTIGERFLMVVFLCFYAFVLCISLLFINIISLCCYERPARWSF